MTYGACASIKVRQRGRVHEAVQHEEYYATTQPSHPKLASHETLPMGTYTPSQPPTFPASNLKRAHNALGTTKVS
jgi:hypothetical protein